MAKQVKVFNGTSTTSMTIYKVPTGRVAKVVVVSVSLTAGGYETATLTIGGEGVGIPSTAVRSNYNMPLLQPLAVAVASGNQLVVDQNMRVASFNGVAYLQRDVYYINAGQTIQVTTAGPNARASWSFLVVEEY